MKLTRSSKVIAILSCALLITSAAYAQSLVASLSVPAAINISTNTGLQLFLPDCTTPLTALTFPSVSAGSTSIVPTCLVPGGPQNEWLDANSLTSTLPASVGTIGWNIVQKQGNNHLSPPIQLVPGNAGSTMLINFTLSSAATASGPTSFTITLNAYSA